MWKFKKNTELLDEVASLSDEIVGISLELAIVKGRMAELECNTEKVGELTQQVSSLRGLLKETGKRLEACPFSKEQEGDKDAN